MPFNNDADNAYLDQQLKTALDNWDPAKPRCWLARYGGLPGLGRKWCVCTGIQNIAGASVNSTKKMG